MPSAATSNFITSKINGDTSLSITLTSICTFLTIYTIPFFLKLFSFITKEDFSIFDVDLTRIIVKVFTIITLPIIIGLLLKHYVPQIKTIEKNIDKISFVFFVIIIKFAIYLSAINIQDPVQNFIAVFTFMIIIVFLISVKFIFMPKPNIMTIIPRELIALKISRATSGGDDKTVKNWSRLILNYLLLS